MKIDSHILFLIVVVGIISAGLVGANVINNDSTMKQLDFDGMKVSVPSGCEFVKVDDGVYKDDNYGITINTFNNNNSMIDFLKNTKKSKVIPLENQPPQSVAFKKGDTISVLVTNGQEGMSISSKDGALSAEIANSIIFSNNHKSEKPTGVGGLHPKMNVSQDFNLIMVLIADVDTKIFNTAIFEQNILVVVDDYNDNIDEPVEDDADSSSEDTYVSDVEDNNDLENILTEGDSSDTDVDTEDDYQKDNSESDVSSEMSSDDDFASSDALSNNDNSVQHEEEKLSFDDCKKIVDKELNPNDDEHFYIIDDEHWDEGPDSYTFFIKNEFNEDLGNITVSTIDGSILENHVMDNSF